MLSWEKQPLTEMMARSLRAASRGGRQQLDGHSFGYDDLKELWTVEDDEAIVHAVLTHDHDPLWQRWSYDQDDKGWTLKDLHETRAGAQEAVLQSGSVPTRGTYLLARFPGGRWMRVRILTKSGPETLAEIFARLGCITRIEEIEEAA